MTLIDSDQRSRATDPRSSFIVQAPAGSGKTEILTQRYLRLLSTVSSPEQIVALTFTRKAATEMRERIILALQQAALNKKATSPHQQLTLSYAQEALSRSVQFNWELLEQPNRLKIITIDSLCQSINQAIPLLEQQIAYAQITDTPERYYLKAARNCIQFAIETPEYQHAIKTLLIHVDNRQERLIDLFKSLLGQRDQWLTPLFQARAQDKATFEDALRFIEQHELSRFRESLPFILADKLTLLARTVAATENNPDSPRYILRDWYDFTQSNQDTCAALCKLILDSTLSIRNSFDHNVGFLKPHYSAEEYKRLKAESVELLAELKEYPDFLDALLQVSTLPKPEYDPEQWEVLQALFVLLPLLASYLQVMFSEQNEVDFTTISHQALVALGELDNPTDLALYLDNAIHHLLIDEFQDTSISQFELITRLVQGWLPDDGKTLFLVGDPMQSIYRFRQAEVGLFFRAKEQGIGSVPLEPLELSCNFRSSAPIVNWVNVHFSKIFPQHIDIESGAVSFHPSVHVIENEVPSAIHAMQCNNRGHEATLLIQVIQDELKAHPDQSVAILVRSRSQLTDIMNLLRHHRIPYQGTDIDLLAKLVHLRDVWSLTQSLLNPGDRLAWLSMLHSPYCGLSLNDLHLIAQFNTKKSIYSALLQLDKIHGLSEEGTTRAQYFAQVMHQSLAQRYQYKLSEWVAKTLTQLFVDKILNQNQLNDLEQFWILIDRYEQKGRLPDMNEFFLEFNKLYSQQTTPSRLQIMTIHKSKGLEFDTVILPGLGTQLKRADQPMLRWLKLPTQNKNDLLLVSPIKAAHQEQCPLYDYLNQLDEEKNHYEAQRVLYVAVTRAKSRLYLFDSSSRVSKSSFRGLLKNQEFNLCQEEERTEQSEYPVPELSKLSLNCYQGSNPVFSNPMNPPPNELVTGIPRLIGITAHQLLQWICDHHPQNADQVPWNLAQLELKKLGFDEEAQLSALSIIRTQITQLFQDKTGLWIIAKHENEQNEYELIVEDQNRLVTRIIDRIFIDQSKLWIIDFKTGKEEESTLTQHQKQLNEYGYYLSSQYSLPIHCGLYYLSNNHWIHWQYEVEEISQ
ncbi:UvrD-helicase domain-containing protein [Legionella quateirensis]|uniref:DNA 3'-5' helicase n=1 Tax=Legionella quateirensis TaxID=45072 RepID=A0A378KT91_9GAMM|nr:UvrD-helicase domain-containing protein [Legionella quateirensis]KTD51219.1 ATP-dependent DNA helicase [Legionella quateirensis]STY17536.1 ATP-dependent DNA helicase (UvrD/Rep helicase) [Legionella quateirensis]